MVGDGGRVVGGGVGSGWGGVVVVVVGAHSNNNNNNNCRQQGRVQKEEIRQRATNTLMRNANSTHNLTL